MSLHLVTGYKGAAHITAEDHGALNACMFGNLEAVLKNGENMSATALTSNTVRIYDGDLIMQGRHVRIEKDTYVDVDIENGTADKNRNDLIVVRYTKDAETGIENVAFVTIKGTETTGTAEDPAYTTGDILSGSCVLHEMPLYRVSLEGINIVGLERLARVVESFNDVMKFEDKTNGAFFRDGEDYPKFGTLPLKYGGTGTRTDLDNAPTNAIVRKLKNDKYNQLYYTATKKGAFYATEENGAAEFGTLPMECGGLGRKDLNVSAPYSILRASSDWNEFPYVSTTPTANGAFYATATNGQPKFGTLPVAQGGTDATNVADALKNLGFDSMDVAVNKTPLRPSGMTAAQGESEITYNKSKCVISDFCDTQVFLNFRVGLSKATAPLYANKYYSVAQIPSNRKPTITTALSCVNTITDSARVLSAYIDTDGIVWVKPSVEISASSGLVLSVSGAWVVW